MVAGFEHEVLVHFLSDAVLLPTKATSSSSQTLQALQSVFIPQHITDSRFLSRTERASERKEREKAREGGRMRGGGSRLWKAGAGSCLAEDLPLERSERPLFMMRDSSKPLALTPQFDSSVCQRLLHTLWSRLVKRCALI
ncbi:unnamed protein product [Leuciscus chuanchicus]